MKTDKTTIELFLERNVVDVISKAEVLQKLHSGQKLRIKLGIDPTNAQIHIGRAVVLWKLRELQDMGHTITLVIGTFTGIIGDASDKDSERPMQDKAFIEANAKLYTKQLAKILDMEKVEMFYNGDWYNSMKLQDFFALTQLFTIQQMIERDNFSKRIDEGKPVGIHETLYPMLQGYDSVVMKTDIEMGGTDQLFNILAGRVVQKSHSMSPQGVITTDLLEGTDGRKMSSSWGNCIYITDEPTDMYGKIMSVRDELVPRYFKMCTDMPTDQIEQIERDMAAGANPRDSKASLARRIVERYHGESASTAAEEAWNSQFVAGQKPTDITSVTSSKGSVLDVVSQVFELSRSDVRRLVEQKGIYIDDVAVESIEQSINKDCLVQVGKRRYMHVKIR